MDRTLHGFRLALSAVSWSVGGLMTASVASAAPEQEGPPPSPDATAPDASVPNGAQGPAAELQQLREELARQQRDVQEARQVAEEARKAADDALRAAEAAQESAEQAANPDASEDAKPEVLRIYGFTEVGFERVWVDKSSLLSTQGPANSSSFVLGNLDMYFDAQPLRDWRSLVEIRLSNAPLGSIIGYGGIAGQFSRANTLQRDPNAGSPAAYQWAATVIIERAQIDWTPSELFKLRVGEFFTPFGIWNVDHGAPTLIPIAIPFPVAVGSFPRRQIGLMAHGNLFAGPWELGYAATLTNGRQELSTFAMDDNRGFGGRLHASLDAGDLVLKFGASGYTGRVRDKQIDLVGVVPTATFASHSTFDYREWALGTDVSLDLNRTRVRLEGILRRVKYDAGKHEPNPNNPTLQLPNRYETGIYGVVAQQLPWAGLEPFVMLEIGYLPMFPGVDTPITPSVGLNIHVTPSVLVKTHLGRTFFTGSRAETKVPGLDPSSYDATSFYSRLVLVF